MLDRTFREFHANIFRLKYFIVRTEEEGKGRESIDRDERDSTPSRTFPDEEIVAWGGYGLTRELLPCRRP